jgi:hypothetical protein
LAEYRCWKADAGKGGMGGVEIGGGWGDSGEDVGGVEMMAEIGEMLGEV